ncbi:PREDICTED: malonyl-coenzyme:anthocyanin 5-O-glucoside-6'''-O-malonyltransferase-like [Nicotiana attenuata]|uniref:Malonyl-coenzyme:anthocyanin 5-o-glucoside-6'''-o-malonyltransferase n=1 Tax=Nicotiana attenuata TaxID=49451 RepID=A0A314LG28_NICAT|nr:PREDICTED: malonyl-coenzyme:anthocyanin 5-O-glucoside-6'''-O-malonyltransferase-like [Nicotiana attenuata]OIT39989.1 malonyl-coenzyme:anthocyanin 5-o-glucoside-6'''-o-malonyltransferase [Nicotiana attenuata]
MASLIVQCQVAPPPGSAAELTLPLTYFDHLWLLFNHNRRILFYKSPISKPDFVQTIIPTLKDSLSLTLKHYLPFAGNVICPLLNCSGYPELRYVTGDSVCVTFSETDTDFDFLVGNHPRNLKDFYHFVPQLRKPKDAPGVQLAPVLAIQVTLFPNHGISIGFTNHHVVGDGATIVRFIRAWALLNKFGGDEQFLANEFVPFYDRSVIKDPYGLGKSIWDEIKKYKLVLCDTTTPPDKVRGTFIVSRDDILKLKNLILSRRPNLTHVTSFTVTCAYIWTCLIKSEAATGEEIDENGVEFFGCAADCRARVNPPIPQTYFGNCIVGYVARTRHADLAGKEGFTIAVELIGETIQKRMKDEEWILNGSWFKECGTVDGNRSLSITGSPKFDLNAADFGWGRLEKLEFVSINNNDGVTMSLSKSKDSDGDLEIGLSLSKTQMNAFAAIFNHGLSFL